MSGKLPKSMYRVGEAEKSRKIFIEQYVISFLREMLTKEKQPQILVFYGNGFEKDGCKCFLLKGAACHRTVEERFSKADAFYFQTVGKKYFPDMIGIGWCYVPDGEKDILEMLQCVQEQNFTGIKGYDIYFDANPGMEEYMLSHGRGMAIEQASSYVGTSVVPETIGVKEKGEKKKLSLWEYIEKLRISPAKAVQILNMVSLCILIVCCIIAVTTMNQYDKMKQLEETVTCLEISIDEQKNLPEE